MTIKVLAFSGSRAEFGLQLPILLALDADQRFKVELILGGTDTSLQGSASRDEAQSVGISVCGEVVTAGISKPADTPVAIAETILGVTQIANRSAPDIAMVYADRFETFGAAVALSQMAIPLVHVEGGDVTFGGTYDDTVRDAISRLAHFHLTTNSLARERLLAMGEDGDRITNIGSTAHEFWIASNYASLEEIVLRLGHSIAESIVIFTLHPISTSKPATMSLVQACRFALQELLQLGIQVIATGSNEDYGNELIKGLLQEMKDLFPNNFYFHETLGRYIFHGLLALASTTSHRVTMLGNSSAGIKEAGIFGCPVVDVGSRQRLRLRGPGVRSVGENPAEILEATAQSLFDDSYRRFVRGAESPYQGLGISNVVPSIFARIASNPDIVIKPPLHPELT